MMSPKFVLICGLRIQRMWPTAKRN